MIINEILQHKSLNLTKKTRGISKLGITQGCQRWVFPPKSGSFHPVWVSISFLLLRIYIYIYIYIYRFLNLRQFTFDISNYLIINEIVIMLYTLLTPSNKHEWDNKWLGQSQRGQCWVFHLNLFLFSPSLGWFLLFFFIKYTCMYIYTCMYVYIYIYRPIYIIIISSW